MIFPLSRVHLYEVFFLKKFTPSTTLQPPEPEPFSRLDHYFFLILCPSLPQPGYSLDPSSGLCADVDECLERCLENGVCTNEEGGFGCECRPGFRLDEGGGSCVDVDECVEIVRRGGRRPCGRARWGSAL